MKHSAHHNLNGILILAVILIMSCQGNKQAPNNSQILHIKIPLTDRQHPIYPDSLFVEKKIVQLETNEECIISGIDKMEIAEDKLYLLDDRQDFIFIFDKDGRYINKIADKGRGAKEYFEISDFHIDDRMIYITAGGARNKIMCYDLNGFFLKQIETEYPTQRITTDSNFIYVYYNFWNNKKYNVGIYDKKENKLIKNYKRFPKQQLGIGYNCRSWTSNNNKIYASFPYEYNIYELTPDTCHIIANIDYGKKYMYPKEWNTYSDQQARAYREKNGGIFDSPIIPECHNLLVSHTRTIFSFIHKRILNWCIINNHTKNFLYGELQPTDYYWNIHGFAPLYINDEYAVNYTHAQSIFSYREKKGKTPELSQEWALDIKEEDNPCLYFYKFKE